VTSGGKGQPARPWQLPRDTAQTRERVVALVEAASHGDLVAQWKSHALHGIGKPKPDVARGVRSRLGLGLFAEWCRGVWQAHDAALGIERLVTKAEALLQANEPTGAANIARRALEHALLDEYRSRLWLITAWAGIGQRDPFLAHAALQQLPATALTVELVTAYLTTCNRVDEATAFLMEARSMGHRARTTSKQLIDLLVLRGTVQEAARVAAEDRDLLSGRDLDALADAGLCVARPQSKP
jgi:hypothetical protein